MQALCEGVWTVFCGALVCAIVGQIGGAGQGLRKMLCGVFLAALTLSSIGKLEVSGIYRALDDYTEDADAVVSAGLEQASQMKFSIITGECEAYILNKAAELGAEVSVTVSLDARTGLPNGAVITGALMPWEKQTLSGEITKALGIKKEALAWSS